MMGDYGEDMRMRRLTDADIQALVDGLAGTRFVGPEEHYEHHRWADGEIAIKKDVEAMRAWAAKRMKEEEDRSSDRRQLKLKLFGWALIGIAGITAAKLGEFVWDAIRAALNMT